MDCCCDNMGQRIGLWVLIVAVVAWYLVTDPLELSPLAGVKDFKPQYVAPPSHDPFFNISWDKENKLQAAEIQGEGELFGPESVVFDVQGKGPYTGISDGRVVRYEGPELGWTTFAITSRNR